LVRAGRKTIALAALAVAVAAASASAQAESPAEPTERPAEVGAVRLELSPREAQHSKGHTFTFARTLDYCGPKGTVKEVILQERPKTTARPFKSAVITVIVEFPAYIQPTVCPPLPPLWETLRVRTKRPADSLIFYDGSYEPPRRLWPPVGETPR
jgi:hypothetical protein